MANWKQLYFAAALETDFAVSQRLTQATEFAILMRILTMPQGAGSDAERQEIAEALSALHVLKFERLKWARLKPREYSQPAPNERAIGASS